MIFTESQQRAIAMIDRPIGIIAGAGTGKTAVLVERCAHLLETGTIGISNLLAITFTDRAAQELRERLFERLPTTLHAQLHGAAITTFHGLCHRILQEHAPLAALAPNFRLLDAAEAHHLHDSAIESTLLQCLEQGDAQVITLVKHFSFRRVCRAIRPLFHEWWNLEHFFASPCSGNATLTPPTPEETALEAAIVHTTRCCQQTYAATKKERQVADFHDLETHTLSLLQEHVEILSDYQRQYRQIVVDEFQDTSPVQHALIGTLFTPPDNILCIVGDPKQSIYRFRGADVSCFHEALTRITEADGEVIILRENFRSLPNVLTFVNEACKAMPAQERLTPTRTEAPGRIEVLPVAVSAPVAARRMAEARAVCDRIAELVGDGVAYGDIACLFPTHAGMDVLAQTLQQGDMPTHIYASRGFFDRREVQDFLYAARWLASLQRRQPDDALLLALLRTPMVGLTEDDCYRLRHMTPPGPRPPSMTWIQSTLHQAVLAHPDIGPALAQWLTSMETCTVPELMAKMLYDTGYADVLMQLDPTGQQLANCEKLLRFVQHHTAGYPTDLTTCLTGLDGLIGSDWQAGDEPVVVAGDQAIQLLTIHAAKGNEFPVVILCDLAAQRAVRTPSWAFMPRVGLAARYLREHGTSTRNREESVRWKELHEYQETADEEEHDRLLYVALTRAADHLILPLAETTDKKEGRWVTQIRKVIPCRS